MPVKKLPVRLICTHCTTGSFPITVHATLVFPVAPVNVWAVGDVSDRIFTAPFLRSIDAFARVVATHDGRR